MPKFLYTLLRHRVLWPLIVFGLVLIFFDAHWTEVAPVLLFLVALGLLEDAVRYWWKRRKGE